MENFIFIKFNYLYLREKKTLKLRHVPVTGYAYNFCSEVCLHRSRFFVTKEYNYTVVTSSEELVMQIDIYYF